MWFYKRVSIAFKVCLLQCYMCFTHVVQHEKEVIDLRKAIELRPPESQGNFEAQCSFQIVALGKYVTTIRNILLRQFLFMLQVTMGI